MEIRNILEWEADKSYLIPGKVQLQATQVAQWWRVFLPDRRWGFDPWVGKIPWKRKWQPTPVFLPGRSHERGGLQSIGSSSRTQLSNWSNDDKVQLQENRKSRGYFGNYVRLTKLKTWGTSSIQFVFPLKHLRDFEVKKHSE